MVVFAVCFFVPFEFSDVFFEFPELSNVRDWFEFSIVAECHGVFVVSVMF